jgi:AcrR family transcriptional regulator
MSRGDPDTRKRILTETWRLMEERRGQGVRLSDIAQAAGISRQAIYLHYSSRAELLIATVRYVDEVHDLDQRLSFFRQASGGLQTLQAYVEFWGSYIPEIYGLAKALLVARENDADAAAAWDDRMEAQRFGCRCVIECLEHEHLLAPGWDIPEATDMMWGMLSVNIWENLTIERGWSQSQYITRIQTALKRILTRSE